MKFYIKNRTDATKIRTQVFAVSPAKDPQQNRKPRKPLTYANDVLAMQIHLRRTNYFGEEYAKSSTGLDKTVLVDGYWGKVKKNGEELLQTASGTKWTKFKPFPKLQPINPIRL